MEWFSFGICITASIAFVFFIFHFRYIIALYMYIVIQFMLISKIGQEIREI